MPPNLAGASVPILRRIVWATYYVHLTPARGNNTTTRCFVRPEKRSMSDLTGLRVDYPVGSSFAVEQENLCSWQILMVDNLTGTSYSPDQAYLYASTKRMLSPNGATDGLEIVPEDATARSTARFASLKALQVGTYWRPWKGFTLPPGDVMESMLNLCFCCRSA